MERRGFLRLLSTTVAGGLMGGRRAWAQAVGAPGAGRAAEAPVASAPGVTAETIKIGMSAVFKGASAVLGSELYRGALVGYRDANERGGIHGRAVGVVALDDGYEPAPCVKNTIQLVEAEKVFFLSNYVGTPTLTRALPVIKRYADQHMLLVGNFTGAQPQREAPYVDQVFNIRASYRQEMAALVDRFWQQGARKFGVFYQIDPYGRSGVDGVARGLAQHGARIAAEATYARGARFDDDMRVAARTLQQAGVDVVLCTGAYQGCGALVRTARDLGWGVPISNVSFVGSGATTRGRS
jgi:branched-chain amino acid transport system substrate-binding protein